MNITDVVSAKDRKALYDRLDPDRSIAMKIWNRERLTVVEAFIAEALGYTMTGRAK